MKLQKQLSKRTKERDYYKYVLNIPPLVVKEAGLGEGDYVDIKVKESKIIIKRTLQNPKNRKILMKSILKIPLKKKKIGIIQTSLKKQSSKNVKKQF